MAKKMRIVNSKRVNDDEIFKKKAENFVKGIGTSSSHFMDIYLIDLLVIIHQSGSTTNVDLAEKMIKRRGTSQIATLQFISVASDRIVNWLYSNGDEDEKKKIKQIAKGPNGATKILEMLVNIIEKS